MVYYVSFYVHRDLMHSAVYLKRRESDTRVRSHRWKDFILLRDALRSYRRQYTLCKQSHRYDRNASRRRIKSFLDYRIGA
ncbi:hypothetical protein NDU88_004929 [Pleurodeles waltl]|uniref:Uncharacterized protein n=1 Tax=Pleurodeles waltl TaxID=8319 RepID=A0AAV7SKC3_PLEWA|nr:hypothetical protein NDU88_004929 [Pleurodeles waltl]